MENLFLAYAGIEFVKQQAACNTDDAEGDVYDDCAGGLIGNLEKLGFKGS